MVIFARQALLALTLLATPILAHAGEEKPAAPPKTAEFVPLGDFTINVPTAGRRREFLVLTVTVETAPGEADKLQAMSPRVQAAILRQLMLLSSEGVLKPNQTDPLTIKDSLYEAISKTQSGPIKDVLITRILFS